MKIAYYCPRCSKEESHETRRVGWYAIQHRCSNCGAVAVLRYSKFKAAALVSLGALAALGAAELAVTLMGRSLFVFLSVFFGLMLLLRALFGSTVVNRSASWHLKDERD